ncbi:MAG: 4Fe-4S dicluster domain-containing protein [Candidatus Limnocylindrales bacterium]
MITSPAPAQTAAARQWFLARSELGALVDAIRDTGRRVIGPTVREGAIVYDEIETAADLPIGWHDEQSAGRYRIEHGNSERVFGYTVGPTTWKRFTFPPNLTIATAQRTHSFGFEPPVPVVPPMAFLGVRACEIAALGIQDRVFLGSEFTDEDFRARRSAAFIVAVQCTTSSSTCFCTSMGTGPEVRSGYDILLTEIEDGFVIQSGSPAGAAVVAKLPTRRPSHAEAGAAVDAVESVRTQMGEPLPMAGIGNRLKLQLDHPRWAQVADRCVECGNCTMSCPTCFCTSVIEKSDMDGKSSATERQWDSCFDVGFAKVAGGDFRARPRDRYRQWLTHKFSTWWDQFGSSGCVGCGRCIAWCPVRIDVREELTAIAPPIAPVVRPVAVEPVAASPGKFSVARLASVRPETEDTSTLTLTDLDPAFLAGRPGQFVMITLPAFPAVPISISRFRANGIDLTIRAVGPTSTALTNLHPGAKVGLRGPLGTFWPIEEAWGRHAVVVAGGVGLSPLHGLVDALVANHDRFESVSLFYGSRTPEDQLFREDLVAWTASKAIDVVVTVDRAGPEWKGRVGVVTNLFDMISWDCSKVTAFVVGPERMMQASVQGLISKGVPADRICVSMERHMECGIGLCGHCQMAGRFVCKDGPVFRLNDLGDMFNREGI